LEWFRQHAGHLKAGKASVDKIFTEDTLSLESHFDAWMSYGQENVFHVRLNNLWKRKNQLSKFLGFKLSLPEMEERSTSLSDLSPEEQLELTSTYESLHHKVTTKSL
jgi:hypothetical protein